MRGRREVTTGRRLSASHGSLGTDCGEDRQERVVREDDRQSCKGGKDEREGGGSFQSNLIILSLNILFYLLIVV